MSLEQCLHARQTYRLHSSQEICLDNSIECSACVTLLMNELGQCISCLARASLEVLIGGWQGLLQHTERLNM